MSVTVVVTRDYDNVPTCFEKYELGTQWRVNGGNLEIFAGRTLAALYPSGNWVSVFVDDAMQLHKGGEQPDYSAMPTVVPSVAQSVADPLGTPVPVPANQPVLDPDGAPWSPPVTGDPAFDDVPLSASGTLFGDDVTDRRAGKIPVAFRPRRYRAAPPPATKAPTGPRLLPIRFRMRQLRQDAPASTDTTPASPRMLPVTMRTTIYRAARQQPEDPDGTDDPNGTKDPDAHSEE